MKKNNKRNEELKEDYKIMSAQELSEKYKISRQRIDQIVRRKAISKGLRARIFERDKHKCQFCDKDLTSGEIHHLNLDPNDNEECNLILLCRHCHIVYHLHFTS